MKLLGKVLKMTLGGPRWGWDTQGWGTPDWD
jgi:hypothetical protein